ncbi:MAG: cell wall-binding repeat-containing protein, partial [Thermoleophilia bacterium]|nr:cell wall-binding repeat-containing protein [Thermoleophilia bacterium]
MKRGGTVGTRKLLGRVARSIFCFSTLLLGAWWFGGAPDAALADPDYAIFRGSDRYATAILVSQAAFAPGVEAVVLAKGDDFADALSAGPLAAAYGGPVLLTPSTSVIPAVLDEIARLNPTRIF